MSPAIQTYSDTEFAHLIAQLAKVTAERDRAREIAVALEQEVAGVRESIAKEIDKHLAANARVNMHGPMASAYGMAARIARGGAA